VKEEKGRIGRTVGVQESKKPSGIKESDRSVILVGEKEKGLILYLKDLEDT
jgi:hypothetical protein